VEDEISLVDVLDFFNESRRLIALCVAACLGVAGFLYVFLPNRYEATGTIQMAVIAGQAVETPQVLIEKIKLPLYFSHTTWDKCDTDEDLTPSRKVAEKIHPILNKTAPFISFTVAGDSVANAKACLEAVVNDVKAKQELLSVPMLQQKKVQLQTLEDKLRQAEEIVKLLGNVQPNLNFKDEKFSASSLVLATKLNNQGSITDLTNQIEDLKISLLPPQTQATSLASPIYCPDFPANKRPLLFLAVGLMSGLFAAIAIALLKKAYASERAKKSAVATN
jgi:uncharacterized protein involved in exopolysaccharide biosynthesis